MTKMLLEKLWVEKYRPKSIKDYVFQDSRHKAVFGQMIRDKSIPQLLLAGVRGTGKTSLARILIDSMGVEMSDVLEINASSERGIDTFRNKVEAFSSAMALGKFKIIHLEEADQLTPDAQKALKSHMEVVSDSVRFILTVNHVNKIIPEIRSRCQEFTFKAADIEEITESMIMMLANERVKCDLNTVDAYVAASYPDQRKIINTLQQYTVDGVLLDPTDGGSGSGEWKLPLVDLVAAGNWVEMRKLVCASVTGGEWEEVYRFMYENISRAPKFTDKEKWDSAVITIAEYLYKHTLVADPEINAAAMFIALGQI